MSGLIIVLLGDPDPDQCPDCGGIMCGGLARDLIGPILESGVEQVDIFQLPAAPDNVIPLFGHREV